MTDSGGFETRPNQDFGENSLKRHRHEGHFLDVSTSRRDSSCGSALNMTGLKGNNERSFFAQAGGQNTFLPRSGRVSGSTVFTAERIGPHPW